MSLNFISNKCFVNCKSETLMHTYKSDYNEENWDEVLLGIQQLDFDTKV